MPIHQKIIVEGFKQVVKLGRVYYRVEGKAFQKLYRGFPQSRTIGRGVRHGLTAGSALGSLINDAPDTPGNGVSKPFKKQPKTNKSNQARNRYASRRITRCDNRARYGKSRR